MGLGLVLDILTSFMYLDHAEMQAARSRAMTMKD